MARLAVHIGGDALCVWQEWTVNDMRLIDADAVIPKGTKVTNDVIAVHTALATAPTVDAVPVVRCKDCGRSIEDGFFCKGIGFLPEHPTLPDKWCSEGYRKDGDG